MCQVRNLPGCAKMRADRLMVFQVSYCCSETNLEKIDNYDHKEMPQVVVIDSDSDYVSRRYFHRRREGQSGKGM